MLQAALFLLGCALSWYLWEIDTIIASVIIGFTSFGILFYLFIVVAGAASVNCPYQTPGAYILRHILSYHPRNIFSRIPFCILPRVLGTLLSVPRILYACIEESTCCLLLVASWDTHNWVWIIAAFVPTLLIGLAFDAYRLMGIMVPLLVTSARRAYGRFRSRPSAPKPGPEMLDLDCILWVL